MSFSLGRQAFLALFVFPLFLTGCGGLKSKDNNAAPTQQAEAAYCETVQTHSSGITITGTATHEYLPLNNSTGLSGTPSTRNTPFAEIRVRNSGGSTVQCGLTDASGAFSVVVPGPGTYTVLVYSRSSSAKLKASVLEDYYANAPYSVSKTFSVSSGPSLAIGSITAAALPASSAKIEGAAFNILYQLYLVNEFLRTELGDASFVAPKVSAYWRVGLNPYTYFGGSTLLSFYRPGLSQLFILGGSNGAFVNADTDHFDNSVIIHEYGHFLEDMYARSDSPGGSHDGDSIVDPRLAWSEGWANFLQAAVQNSPWYIDTKGYGGSPNGGILIKVNLNQAGATASQDSVGTAGEGTYREMSISRYLYKTIKGLNVSDTPVPFKSLWEAFSFTDSGGNPVGLASSQVAFRNIGLFNKYLGARITSLGNSAISTSWVSARDDERQPASTGYYADSLTPMTSGSCSNFKTLSPVRDDDGYSNLFMSNHFFRYDHDGSATTLNLAYTPGSPTKDVDLHLYTEDYVYQESGQAANGTILRSSARPVSVESGAESVSLSGLPAGRYLINIKVLTQNKLPANLTGTVSYTLRRTKNSVTEDLCPAN